MKRIVTIILCLSFLTTSARVKLNLPAWIRTMPEIPQVAQIAIDMQSLGVLPNTNCASRIQRILDSIPDNRALLFIYVSVYTIDSPLVNRRHNISIIGLDSNQTIFRFSNLYDYMAFYGERVGVFNNGGNSFRMENCQIDLNHRGSGKPDGVLGSITGLSCGLHWTGTSVTVTNVVVRNCKFYDYYADAFDNAYAAVGQGNVFLVENCVFVSTYIVQGWDFAASAGEQAISFVKVNYGWIKNNKIYGALDDAIALHGGNNIIVSGNDITTTGGRIIMSGTQHVIVTNNFMRCIENGAYAFQVTFAEGADPRPAKDVWIVNNHVIIDSGAYLNYFVRIWGAGVGIHILNNKFEAHDYLPYAVRLSSKTDLYGVVHFGDSIEIKGNTTLNAGRTMFVNYSGASPNMLLDTTDNFAGAFNATVPPDPITGAVTIGAWINDNTLSTQEKIDVMSLLLTDETRSEVNINTYSGSASAEYVYFKNNNQSVTLTVNNNTSGVFATDTNAYKVSLADIEADHYLPKMYVIERYPTATANGPIIDYINELKAATTFLRAQPRKVTNGGFSGRDMTYLIYKDYVSRGALDSAADFAGRCIPTRLVAALATPGTDLVLDAYIARLDSLVAALATIDLTYVNFNVYEPVKYEGETGATLSSQSITASTFRFFSEVGVYLRRVTGHAVVCTEVGQLNTNGVYTTSILENMEFGHFKHILWRSEDQGTDKGKPLHSGTTLLLTGEAFAAYMENQ